MKEVLKQLYKLVPFKKQLFIAIKHIFNPSEKLYKHLNFVDIIKVAIDKNKSFKINHYGYQIENEIFWSGLTNGWEKESIKLWIKLCEKSNVVLDIGANTGVYSLIAKTVNPSSKVYAFEPVSL